MSGDELKEAPVREYQVMPPDSPYAALAEEIYRGRILHAREESLDQKFLAGEELFEWACSITLLGIKNENPGISDEASLRILEQRLALRERLEKIP